MMNKAWRITDSDNQPLGYAVNCPACGHAHMVNVDRPAPNGAQWSFNGNLERPTFSPSLLIRGEGWIKIPNDQWMPVVSNTLSDGVGQRVPFALLKEDQAQQNHKRSLADQRQLGGLSFCEIMCLMDGVQSVGMGEPDCAEVVKQRTKTYLNSLPAYVCHSFVRDGRIEYLGDCTHSRAGTTVELPNEDWT